MYCLCSMYCVCADAARSSCSTCSPASRSRARRTPNNILRVGGGWKLSDLDNLPPARHATDRFPLDRYRQAAKVVGAPAEQRSDIYGRERIVGRLSETQ